MLPVLLLGCCPALCLLMVLVLLLVVLLVLLEGEIAAWRSRDMTKVLGVLRMLGVLRSQQGHWRRLSLLLAGSRSQVCPVMRRPEWLQGGRDGQRRREGCLHVRLRLLMLLMKLLMVIPRYRCAAGGIRWLRMSPGGVPSACWWRRRRRRLSQMATIGMQQRRV